MPDQAIKQEARRGFIRRYVFSLDHKVIGLQYYFLALASVLIAVGLSLLMRLQLAWPGEKFGFLKFIFPHAAANGTISPELYLSIVTMHGTLMVFFVLTVAPQSAFGNYFLPIQIGAEEMAFPVLNMLSFWVTLLALLVLITAFFAESGVIGPISGWTAYAPLSSLGEAAGPGQGTGIILWIASIALFCIGSLLSSINFITTMVIMRTRGMKLLRLPLTCWGWFTSAILSLLSFPVLLAAGILLLLDHTAHTSFFTPGGLVVNGKLQAVQQGGSPILWQHLFWFFGHPEVYIAILPGMGLTSTLLANFSRKPVFGYKPMVIAIFAIGFLGFFVWGHHMFVSGMHPGIVLAFSMFTMVIGVPSAVKTFNWLATMWGGKIRFTAAMMFSIGFVSMFVSGGLTGLFLGQSELDIQLHDTQFVVGHFHLIMGVAALFGIFAGTYYWAPKMFGRLMNERLGKLHFWLTFVGTNCIFIPMYIMGIMGAPRRYSMYFNPATGEGLHYLSSMGPLVKFVSYAAFITAAAQLIFLFNLFYSILRGEKAPQNPWQATTLEWSIPSPVPRESFGGRHVVVYRGPYEYSVPNAPSDFLMQDEPGDQ